MRKNNNGTEDTLRPVFGNNTAAVADAAAKQRGVDYQANREVDDGGNYFWVNVMTGPGRNTEENRDWTRNKWASYKNTATGPSDWYCTKNSETGDYLRTAKERSYLSKLEADRYAFCMRVAAKFVKRFPDWETYFYNKEVYQYIQPKPGLIIYLSFHLPQQPSVADVEEDFDLPINTAIDKAADAQAEAFRASRKQPKFKANPQPKQEAAAAPSKSRVAIPEGDDDDELEG